MYAFHLSGASAPRAYSCYVSDLTSVWVHQATGEEFAEKAKKLGMSRVDSKTLDILAKEIYTAFYEEKSAIVKPLNADFLVSVHLGSLTWEMRLQKIDPTKSAAFMAALNIHQFANHSYLAYKVSQLEKALRAKDKYTLYLEENYKTVNGTALMDKYRRQNAGEAVLLEPYSRAAFDAHVDEHYGSLARRLEACPSSWTTLLYDVIGSVFHDVQTWTTGAWILGHLKEEASEAPDPAVKSEPASKVVKSEPRDDPIPKLEPASTPSQGSSPSKRQRVGLLGRKRPAPKSSPQKGQNPEDQPSESDHAETQNDQNTQSSPLKRKRVGDLRRR